VIDTITKIRDHEKRMAIGSYTKSLEIVNRAIESDSLIVLGKQRFAKPREEEKTCSERILYS
jgi:hypothetical protein